MNFDKGSTQQHQDLLKAFNKAAFLEFDNIIILPYTVGMFRDFDSAVRIIHAGIKGVPDTLILGCGWYVFLDAKTGKARFTIEQAAFKKRISQINKGTDHVYKLTSVEQGLNIIRAAKKYYEK